MGAVSTLAGSSSAPSANASFGTKESSTAATEERRSPGWWGHTVSEPSEDPSAEECAEECADDRARLQRYDEESRSAPGLRSTEAHAASAVEDERDLQRQPDHGEALQRPGDEERGEAVGLHESPARAGREHRADEQDALEYEHVAEFREYRHDERGEQELCRLESVEVRVADMGHLARSLISGT